MRSRTNAKIAEKSFRNLYIRILLRLLMASPDVLCSFKLTTRFLLFVCMFMIHDGLFYTRLTRELACEDLSFSFLRVYVCV